MNGEFNLDGVFVSSLLIYAGLAFLITAMATRLLALAGFYRLVWHRALFDFALFVIVWGGVAAVASTPTFHLPGVG
ncbi:MAG: DUF1656 domain-containing protein [Caulobacteraceae bacterium]